MIKVDKGNIDIDGSKAMLLAELSGIILAFREKHIASNEMILHAVDLGMMSKEEINKKTIEAINRIPANLLKKFVKDYFEEENK